MASERLKRAKRRCADCVALVAHEVDDITEWRCDEGNCPIEDVERCLEWEGDRGELNNPEWAKEIE